MPDVGLVRASAFIDSWREHDVSHHSSTVTRDSSGPTRFNISYDLLEKTVIRGCQISQILPRRQLPATNRPSGNIAPETEIYLLHYESEPQGIRSYRWVIVSVDETMYPGCRRNVPSCVSCFKCNQNSLLSLGHHSRSSANCTPIFVNLIMGRIMYISRLSCDEMTSRSPTLVEPLSVWLEQRWSPANALFVASEVKLMYTALSTAGYAFVGSNYGSAFVIHAPSRTSVTCKPLVVFPLLHSIIHLPSEAFSVPTEFIAPILRIADFSSLMSHLWAKQPTKIGRSAVGGGGVACKRKRGRPASGVTTATRRVPSSSIKMMGEKESKYTQYFPRPTIDLSLMKVTIGPLNLQTVNLCDVSPPSVKMYRDVARSNVTAVLIVFVESTLLQIISILTGTMTELGKPLVGNAWKCGTNLATRCGHSSLTTCLNPFVPNKVNGQQPNVSLCANCGPNCRITSSSLAETAGTQTGLSTCKTQLFLDVVHNEICVNYYDLAQRYLDCAVLDLSGNFEQSVREIIDRIFTAFPFK
jgi:hypothetical protein